MPWRLCWSPVPMSTYAVVLGRLLSKRLYVVGGHIPVIKAILGHGADVNARDHMDNSALHMAAIENQTDAIDALIDAGAKIELKGFFGGTPLAWAAVYGSVESMIALVERGAQVMMTDDDEETPLHHACFQANPVAVDLLLRWGADETALNKGGLTPADMLEKVRRFGEDRRPTEEVERVRLLLARAPTDRAWASAGLAGPASITRCKGNRPQL